jgi:hypothetical protein
MGRPTKLSRPIKLFILFTTIANPQISGQKLKLLIMATFGVQIFEVLINIFRHNISFKFGRWIPVLVLTPIHKMNRVQFANGFLTSGISANQVFFQMKNGSLERIRTKKYGD